MKLRTETNVKLPLYTSVIRTRRASRVATERSGARTIAEQKQTHARDLRHPRPVSANGSAKIKPARCETGTFWRVPVIFPRDGSIQPQWGPFGLTSLPGWMRRRGQNDARRM